MPARNVVKIYYENGFYHVYNRGVEKRTIFLDNQDYTVFLHFLKKYLTPVPETSAESANFWGAASSEFREAPYESLYGEIDLLAYCLMPNHYHLLLQQKKIDSMIKLLRRVCTSYVIYFNKKYNRVGSLFQGIYKAVEIDTEQYLLHVSRYIHLNPFELFTEVQPLQRCGLLREYSWSSYPDYYGNRSTLWVKTQPVLSYFSSTKNRNPGFANINSYQKFVEDYIIDPREAIGTLSLD